MEAGTDPTRVTEQRLRDYQARVVDDVRSRIARGAGSVLVVAPTDAGKTTVGAELAGDGSVLWLAHTRELVDQAAQRLAERHGVDAVGVVMPGVEARPASMGPAVLVCARSRDRTVLRAIAGLAASSCAR